MIRYYKNKVCLNVLATTVENAKEIYEAAEGNVLVGVLSANYPDVASAVKSMNEFAEVLQGQLSVGLGGGNPNQWQAVGDIARSVLADHFNQVFTAVSYTRANAINPHAHINALVGPSGTVGMVKISTGPLSSKSEQPAVIPVSTAIDMIKDMGGNSLKFFPMGGLKVKEELEAVAAACAKQNFILEPTGGIDLNNFEEIVTLILKAGVQQVIPHVYSSIIDKESGLTKIEDVKTLMSIIKKIC
ncbi:MAG: KDGP aldolase [Erysipelotrichaceae bacterium]|jgi:uncharacterized protein (TIGR03581 family)|nr:KDGP aldolase [Erysipelotrichaceae bacterium]